MEIKKTDNILLITVLGSLFGVMTLGIWWLYLLIKMGQLDPQAMQTNVVRLAKWEGGTFLFLLITLTVSFLILYFKEIRQTKSLQNFFSSLTHELKTPLASIRLQSEVLAEKLEKNDSSSKEFEIAERLIEDTQNLETQMDKIIQLSKVTREKNLPLSQFPIKEILKDIVKNYANDIELEIEGLGDHQIFGDQFAIELILKNLIENTKHHSKNKKAKIFIKDIEYHLCVIYEDDGKFQGDLKKLGKLFYTNHSSRGSGIGLFLIKNLMNAMKGRAKITPESDKFFVELIFNKKGSSKA